MIHKLMLLLVLLIFDYLLLLLHYQVMCDMLINLDFLLLYFLLLFVNFYVSGFVAVCLGLLDCQLQLKVSKG